MKFILIVTILITPYILTVAGIESPEGRKRESPISYISATIPNEIYRCMKNFKLVRCMKWFLLSRMDTQSENYPNTGNLTADVLQQFLSNDNVKNLTDYAEVYQHLNDSEVNAKLYEGLQKFFENRALLLHVIPGMVVKITPNNQNTLDFSLKKGEYSDYYRVFITVALDTK